MRINRFIAQSGFCSRRKADQLIESGQVRINGNLIRDFSYAVSDEDRVEIGTERIKAVTHFDYLILRKPKRYITAVSDDRGRETVLDLVDSKERIYPIGRLDYHSSGVLLLTNDGDFAHYLSHPSSEIEKIYDVVVNQELPERVIDELRSGIEIDGRKTSPCLIERLQSDDHRMRLRFHLHEGRNRQIRKMLEAVSATAFKLDRISYGGITYKGLKSGEYRHLKKDELKRLKKGMKNS